MLKQKKKKMKFDRKPYTIFRQIVTHHPETLFYHINNSIKKLKSIQWIKLSTI